MREHIVEEDENVGGADDAPVKAMKEHTQKLKGAGWLKKKKVYNREDILITFMAHDPRYEESIWELSKEWFQAGKQGNYSRSMVRKGISPIIKTAAAELASKADVTPGIAFDKRHLDSVENRMVRDFEGYFERSQSTILDKDDPDAPEDVPSEPPSEPTNEPDPEPTGDDPVDGDGDGEVNDANQAKGEEPGENAPSGEKDEPEPKKKTKKKKQAVKESVMGENLDNLISRWSGGELMSESRSLAELDDVLEPTPEERVRVRVETLLGECARVIGHEVGEGSFVYRELLGAELAGEVVESLMDEDRDRFLRAGLGVDSQLRLSRIFNRMQESTGLERQRLRRALEETGAPLIVTPTTLGGLRGMDAPSTVEVGDDLEALLKQAAEGGPKLVGTVTMTKENAASCLAALAGCKKELKQKMLARGAMELLDFAQRMGY